MAEICKFDELRLKTGRELVQLINHELDFGIREARQALRADRWAVAEGHFLAAQREYAKVSRLIPLVGEVPGDQPDRREASLTQLREMLDGLFVLGSTPTRTTENITPLARAWWEARGCPEGSPEDDWFRAERALMQKLHTVCC